jgi:hypothetical protein
MVKFFFDATTKMFEFQVSDGKYSLFSLKYSDHPYSLVADFAKGTKLKNFLVQTEEECALFVMFAREYAHDCFFSLHRRTQGQRRRSGCSRRW